MWLYYEDVEACSFSHLANVVFMKFIAATIGQAKWWNLSSVH